MSGADDARRALIIEHADQLDARQRDLVLLRLGTDRHSEPRSIEAVSAATGVPREEIRRAEAALMATGLRERLQDEHD